MINVDQNKLESMRTAKGGNYKWKTGSPNKSSRYLLAHEGYLTADDKPIMLSCTKCQSSYLINGCDKCGQGDLRFRYSGDGSNAEMSLQCGSCGKNSSTWTCEKCGTSNVYAQATPYVKTVYWLDKEGKCFIATAVYGSYSAPEVMILRQFRNNILLKNSVGSLIVKVYYLLSPPLAYLISKNIYLRNTVKRFLLTPTVKIIDVINSHIGQNK